MKVISKKEAISILFQLAQYNLAPEEEMEGISIPNYDEIANMFSKVNQYINQSPLDSEVEEAIELLMKYGNDGENVMNKYNTIRQALSDKDETIKTHEEIENGLSSIIRRQSSQLNQIREVVEKWPLSAINCGGYRRIKQILGDEKK